MATRFYLPSSGTAPVMPAYGGLWETTASADRRPLPTAPSDTAHTDVGVSESVATNPYDVLLRQFISEPVAAQTITGTLTGVIRALESAGTADMFQQIRVSVVSGDGSTERGELFSGHTTAVAPEFGSNVTITYASLSLGSVAASSGDRIVVELGYRATNTTTASRTGTLRFGDLASSSDFAFTAGLSTDLRPWVEFSQTITFAGKEVSLAGTTAAPVGSFSATVAESLSLAGQTAPVVGDFTVTVGNTDLIDLDGTTAGVVGAFSLDAVQSVSLAGTTAPVVGAFSAAISVPVYEDAVLDAGPDIYLRLDDTATPTAVDVSGNNNDGTYVTVGTPPTFGVPSLLATDPANPAVDFGGTGSHVEVPWTGFDDDYSVSFMIEPDPTLGTRVHRVGVFDIEVYSLGEIFHDRISVTVWDGGNPDPLTQPALHQDLGLLLEPVHVMVTVTAASFKLYLDGALRGTQPAVRAPLTTDPDEPIVVGSRADASEPSGVMDEFIYYARSLSAAEVALIASFVTTGQPDISLAGQTAAPTAAFSVITPLEMSLASTVGGVVGEFSITVPLATNLNISDADDIDGIVTWAWDPPIVAPPAVVGPQYDYITALAYTGLDLESGAPQLTDLQEPERVRPPIRILVAGRDVTYWRGKAIPEPTYSLISPLGYGSGSISFPQVHVPFEQPGVGALHWLKPLARVVIQRLNDTGDTVVADYWRGFLGAQDVDGGALTFQLEGEASGRLSALDRQPRVFRRRNDLGYWWHSLIRELKLPAGPKVDTGIVLQNAGGMDGPEYAAHLSAKGVGRAGNQWTVMPNADGVYVTARKDRTTIDATVYFDTDRTVAKLRRDPFEEPNRIFATAVSPGGRRIRFADYPVLQDVRALPYPMDDGSPFGEGTTDGDTDTGSGVTVMLSRLVHTGYLSQEDRPGGFDGDVTKALLELQDDAGLAQTGNMNENTWDALFDVGITGYDTGGAKIRPAVQLSATRKYNYTAAGIVRGLNPDYDPTVMPVDRTIDVGTGFTENQVKEFARQQLQESADPNWVGSVAFTPPANVGGAIGLIEGEHTPGDPVTSGMVMDARRLKPGMNVWAPLWDGGTLFHVSGVEVSGRSVTAALDTRARDTMELYEVIDRIRESRRRPGRTWMQSHRGSDINNDIVHEGDAIGGQVQPTALKGDTWNVIPVVVGQEGQINKLRLKVTANAAYADVEGPGVEYVCAVFGRKIPAARLNARIGDPLTAEGSEKWTDQGVLDDLDDNWVLLYVAGNNEQPCGYGSKRKGDPGATLSGRWEYDAGFPYYAYDDCSLWLAIYPATDSALKGQRVLWNQNEWS